MRRGFLLQATWYLVAGRPVIHLFGVDEEGDSFVIRDNTTRPRFFVRADDRERVVMLSREPTERGARRLPTFSLEDVPLRTTEGDPALALVLTTPRELPVLRDALESGAIPTYEADLPFATRFLLEHGLRGAFAIEGESTPGRLVRRIYHNPRLHPAVFAPELRALAIDIETDPAAERVLSVAFAGKEQHQVWMVSPSGESGSEEVLGVRGERFTLERCADERALLTRFEEALRAADPDVLTGWNVIDFDLSVLARASRRHGLPFHLGRADLPVDLRIDRESWGRSRAILPGRVVLDGLTLVRDAFIKLEDYRLETAAQSILGRGKSVHDTSGGEEILRLWNEDPLTFARYNHNDAVLVRDILTEKRLLELTVRRSLLTGMPPDRVSASIASFDYLYLSELHQRGQVAPTVRAAPSGRWTQGGAVLDSKPGVHSSVLVLDYRSLYPSVVRTFRIDPLGHLPVGGEGTDSLRAPNGASFRREGGILPAILDRLFPARGEAIARGDGLESMAIKILMNSFYGVLASPRCRFFSPDTADAITGFGQAILHWTREALERRGLRVLYGDTDSLFVASGESQPPADLDLAERLVQGLNQELSFWVREHYQLESRLELRFDRLFSRLLIPALRGSRIGSKKRYAGIDAATDSVVLVGLEAVRRDWTPLARRFQTELVTEALRDRAIEPYVRQFVAALRAGEHDELLGYRSGTRRGRERFVQTIHGPEPLGERVHPPDYAHYIEKQLRPVAEVVIALLDVTWEEITSEQGRLPF